MAAVTACALHIAVLLVLCCGSYGGKLRKNYEDRLAQMERYIKSVVDANGRLEKLNQAQRLEIEELGTRLKALERTCTSSPAKRDVVDPTSLTETQTTVDNMAELLDSVSALMDAMEQEISDSKASVYVRWGHRQCPDGAEMVYTGYVGGSHYQSPGGAANYLCLPPNPDFDQTRNIPNLAQLFGAEYHTYGESTYLLDAVCTVCRPPRATSVMVAGATHCWEGWTLEYVGHLMAGRPDHASSSEFICVDKALQSNSTTATADDGKLLYYTATHCGSLPCPPYQGERVVTCAVCSK